MKTVPFPSIQLGVDMLSNETSIPKGAVRQAINVDLDRYGNFSRRTGYTRVVSGAGFHSVRTMWQKGWILLAQDATLKAISPSDYSMTTLYTLNSADPVDYCEHNGNVYFSNRTTAGYIPYGSTVARQLGVPVPGTGPSLSTATTGSLVPGTYTLAYTFIDDLGEESGTSDYVKITLTTTGSIVASSLPTHSGWKLRIYMSAPDGEELFLNSEFNAVTSMTQITTPTQLKHVGDKVLVPMEPGSHIRAHNGRLYTCKDNVITFSEPLRYGATNLSYNRIQLNDNITIFEPVLGGIYVGAGTKVWFMEGGDPSKFTQKLVSNCRAIPNSSTLVPGEHFNPKVVDPDYPVAVWLSTSGYVAGQADGKLVELQPDRVRIPGNQAGRSTFLIRNGMKQVLTPVNSTSAVAFGTAVDSSTS